MNEKKLIAIGGGTLAEKTTNKIDAYVAELAKQRAGDRRPVGVFIGTASHDSMPYFNTFRKTYTSDFGLKADCVLSVYGEMNHEKIQTKFEKADLIYIGGGDTVFMLDWWKKQGIYDLVIDAYNRGVVIAGLSAGAICWFEKMYTDSVNFSSDGAYSVCDGMKIINGVCCPHYEERFPDFEPILDNFKNTDCWCIESNSAIVFTDGIFSEALSSGGNAFLLRNCDGNIIKRKLTK